MKTKNRMTSPNTIRFRFNEVKCKQLNLLNLRKDMIIIRRFSIKNANTRLTLRIMKLITLFLILGIGVCFSNNTYSQTAKLSLSLKNRTVKEVLAEIEKSSEYVFLYHDENLDTNRKVSIEIKDQTIEKILDNLFRGTNNTYFISDRQVFISKSKEALERLKKEEEQQQQKPDPRILITGTVADSNGEPLIGVTVRQKSGRSAGAVSGLSGEFSIYVYNMNESLIFTYVGMETKEIKLKAGTTTYKVVMSESNTELESVVIEAGIIQRDKIGFTGSYTSVTGDELRAVGNMNVLQSLKSFDPGVIMLDNNLQGSNPNQLATIEVRGKTTLNLTSVQDDAASNPNQPLFILDGFEASLTEINDLDINRVASLTILKDAGSTAIYGAKGANGVIVVETIKPRAGELMLTYTGNFRLGWADLGVYNMMNAAEKLEFERKAGIYGDLENYEGNIGNISKYNNILNDIARGVDTYWLKQPIRTGFTNNHSLGASGGDKNIQYQVNLNYQNYGGVMKDTKRETYGGNIRLIYRGINKLNISNNLAVSGLNSYTGSWGSFSDFVNANPYRSPWDENGVVRRNLDPTEEEFVANPLYNASLKSEQKSKGYTIINNTNLDWYISDSFRVYAALGLKKTASNSKSFTDPRHTKYKDTEYSRKGSYTESNGDLWGYDASVRATYTKTFLDAHTLTGTARVGINETNRDNTGFSVTGFPEGVGAIPSFAYSYVPDTRPSFTLEKERAVNTVGAFNYMYKQRYLFDFNYNVSGSTVFGSKNKYASFWALGAGWNIFKEKFIEELGWIDNLKLRGTFGTNANQNSGSTLNTSVYKYQVGNDLFGTGSYMNIYANPDLDWELTEKLTVGLDASFWNRLRFTVEYYEERTDPLAIIIPQKASTGIPNAYAVNAGFLKSKGVEFTVAYTVINNPKDRIYLNLRLNGSHGKTTYGGFGNLLDELNNELFDGENKTDQTALQRYQDGYSPEDIWAVRSLGIDPATGHEVFLDADGNKTMTYNGNRDRVRVASSRPTLEGTQNISFTYKKIMANMTFRYRFGGSTLNTALYRKVENISGTAVLNNQDKRALYDRWQKPGDIAQFKSISTSTSTPISSRFIQKDNIFRGESINISWDFTGDNWIKSFGLKDLRMGVSMSDIFTLSSIKVERGIDYPFERSISFNLSCRF